MIGGDNAIRSMQITKPGGTVVAVPGGVAAELTAAVEQVFPRSEIRAAHERQESGRAMGISS